MNLWKIAAIGSVGVLVTVACTSDDNGIMNAGGTSGSGGSNEGGDGQGGSSAGKGGTTAGSAGKGGNTPGGTGGTTAGTGGSAGKGGTSSGDAGMGGMAEGGDTGMGGMGGSSEGGAGGEGGSPEPSGPLSHCNGCSRTKIGKPLWEPSGVIAIAGDVGTTTPDPLIAFLKGFVGPNHAWDDNDFIVGPKQPHAGPYNDELFTLATTAGHTPKQTFSKAEFTGPKGVIICFNIIPSAGAPTGSSFDFASGPIMPKAMFPLKVDGDMYREGELYDPFFDGEFGGYQSLTPPIDKDGASHLFWFFAEDNAFGPENTPTSGSYQFDLKITDAGGLGWNLTVPFVVSNN